MPSAGPEGALEEFLKFAERQDTSVVVAAVQALTDLLRNSDETTILGQEKQLTDAITAIQRQGISRDRIGLRSGIDLFKRYISRYNRDCEFEEGKKAMLQRAELFKAKVEGARNLAASYLSQSFQGRQVTIMIHGHSRAVVRAVAQAAFDNPYCHVRAFVSGDNTPDGRSARTIKGIRATFDTLVEEHQAKNGKEAAEAPTLSADFTIFPDSAMAYWLPEVDFALVGAEGVVETGGIINAVGTYQLGLLAKGCNRPLHAVVESYKFVRYYPLSQKDVKQPDRRTEGERVSAAKSAAELDVDLVHMELDYTPPDCLTFLFTDQGILSPSAVSDELIRQYYEPLLTL